MTERTTVLVADDHPVYREGIADAIKRSAQMNLVAECASGDAALAGIRELGPDVAVLDMQLPGLTATQVASIVRREQGRTSVLVLSAFVDSAIVYEAVVAGAAGYLSKDEGRAQICDAILAVARGDSVFSPNVHGGLAEQIRRHSDPAQLGLSPRETQVLGLIAEGCSTPEIGRRLHVSETTVKSHLQTLYGKLGVRERAAAVAEGMRRGLIR